MLQARRYVTERRSNRCVCSGEPTGIRSRGCGVPPAQPLRISAATALSCPCHNKLRPQERPPQPLDMLPCPKARPPPASVAALPSVHLASGPRPPVAARATAGTTRRAGAWPPMAPSTWAPACHRARSCARRWRRPCRGRCPGRSPCRRRPGSRGRCARSRGSRSPCCRPPCTRRGGSGCACGRAGGLLGRVGAAWENAAAAAAQQQLPRRHHWHPAPTAQQTPPSSATNHLS